MSARGLIALLLLALSGTASAQGYYPGSAARVNGVDISYQRFNGFYVEYRNTKGVSVGARGDQLPLLTQLRQEAMDQIIDQELVRQAAEKAEIEVSAEEVQAGIDELRSVFKSPASFAARLQNEGFPDEDSYRRHVAGMVAASRYLDRIRAAVPEVSDEELETYYRENERRLTFPEQVRVRHILLKWKPLGTGDDRAALREQILPILERARNGEDFAQLARQYSEDSGTAANGGDTGLFRRGQMAADFERAAFALEVGEISEPVNTLYGVHIIRLEERLEPHLLPLDEVREQLRDHVRNERAEQAVKEEIARLREGAEIEILIPLSR